MFRRKSTVLPPDPYFPANLKELGYFINEKDQIRMITTPTQEFHYFISKNERVVQMQREAMDTCVRNILAPRFEAAALETIRLPPGRSPTDPHIPILATSNIRTAKRIILYLGESCQDLGIFAYRTIGQVSLSAGSVIDFVEAIRKQGCDDVAVVIANPGQVLWNRRNGRAMSLKSWDALPRKGGMGMPTAITEANRVEGHEDGERHVGSIFEWVEGTMREGAKVDVVGICEGWEKGMRFLSEEGNWKKWEGKVGGIVMGLGYSKGVDDDIDGDGLREFVAKRGRAYLLHESELGTPLEGRNLFASGEQAYTECIMPQAYPAILDFLQRVADHPNYEEPLVIVDRPNLEDDEALAGWSWECNEKDADDSPPYISPMLAQLLALEANGGSAGDKNGKITGEVSVEVRPTDL